MAQFKLRKKWGNVTKQIGGGIVADGVAVVLPPSPTGYEIRSIIASVNAQRQDALVAAELNGGSTLLIGRGDIGDNTQNPILVARPYDTPTVPYDDVQLMMPVQTNVPLVMTFPPGTSPFTVEADQPLVIALSDATDETGVVWTHHGFLSLTVQGCPLIASDSPMQRVRLR